MSKLLEWKFDVINDSLDKLFVLVEKNEHPRMLDDLNAFVKKTGKLELEDSSFMSPCVRIVVASINLQINRER